MSGEHIGLLERVQRGPEMLALARWNAKLAKSYRGDFAEMTEELIRKYKN
jgi:hypothetical protein